MEFSTLKAFLAIAAEGSFSQAAERLFITQPAVSKRIAALERELDTPLFDRAGKRVMLTQAGATLLPHAREIIATAEHAVELVTNLTGTVSGPLRIASSHHIGLHRFPNILERYTRAYPDVELDLRFLDSETACQQVESGELELALITLPERLPDTLTKTVIWHDPLAVVVTSSAKEENDIIGFLMTTGAILPPRTTWTRKHIERQFSAFGVPLHTRMETNNLETIRKMVEIGLGWSVLPATMHSQEMRVLPVSGLQLQRNLGLVRQRQRTFSNAAKAMIALLEGEEGTNTPSSIG